jgi:hypothetical protein
MNTKKLIITGKNNVETISDLGDERIKINALENEIEHEKALSLLLDLDKCKLFTKEDVLYKKAKREINDKINSYKQQDIKKNIHNKDTLITFNNIKNKLLNNFLLCTYCKQRVKFLYRIVRDEYQWTLDRIDNKKNHTDENTVISCLKCNLKRRCLDKKKFEFSQNLSIVKLS